MTLNKLTTHIEQAKKNLQAQFQDLPNFDKLLGSVFVQIDELEAVLQDLYSNRNIFTAIGQQLDNIGTLLGEERAANDDEQYRQILLSKILVNKSSGTIPEIINIALFLTEVINSQSTSIAIEDGIGFVLIRIDRLPVDNLFFNLIVAAIPASVRLEVLYDGYETDFDKINPILCTEIADASGTGASDFGYGLSGDPITSWDLNRGILAQIESE